MSKTKTVIIRTIIVTIVLILAGLGACAAFELPDPISVEQRARAEATFDAQALDAALTDISRWHHDNQTQIAAALQPGLEEAVVQEKFATLPCRPTEELVQLWGWHNGTRDTAQPFIWYHNFLPVEQVITEYEALRANPRLGWRENWLPVFEFEGEWYFVECDDRPRTASPVGYFFQEDTEAIVAYTSLTKMLETSAAWFKKRAVTWDARQEAMQEDLKRLLEIHQDLNEDARFPYHVENSDK